MLPNNICGQKVVTGISIYITERSDIIVNSVSIAAAYVRQ